MSNENQDQELNDLPAPDRLAHLKQKATMMGIPFSNNISVETLSARIEEKLSSKGVTSEDAPELNPLEGDVAGAVPTRQLSEREIQKRDQLALIRVRITNMNPHKGDLPGEIFCVANEVIGEVKKYIPYNEAGEDGWHVPKILLTMLQEKKYLHIKIVKDKRTGTTRPIESWAREFAIEVLPPLTKEELRTLAAAQIAAGTVTAGNE